MHIWKKILLLLIASCCLPQACAGVMTREAMRKNFPAPLIVADKAGDIPVWPLFRQNATANELVGYVFESVDLAPVPGFSGVPVNLLIAIDPKGNFLDVKVLSHHEPVFLEGLGEAPLFQFVSQYRGLSLNQNIKIEARNGRQSGGANAYLDGVTKATASVRIINQTVLASALKVAHKKLGFSAGRDPDLIARIKPDLQEQHSIRSMLDDGLIKHLTLYNKDIEKKFATGGGAGLDPEAVNHPDAVFIDLYLAYVSVPSIGSNLLNAASWDKLQKRLEPGDHAILVMSNGRYGIAGDDFIPGSVPERLLLQQDKLPLEMRDLNMEMQLKDTRDLPAPEQLKVFRIIGQSGLDPSRPLDFLLPVIRSKGIVYPERFTENFAVSMTLPARFYTVPDSDNKTWQGIWKSRWPELAILAAALALLSLVLIRQRQLTRNGRRFIRFRLGFLLFTLLFIGWYAQGQLSIVNITGLLQALAAGRSLDFFLYDPMTVTLWAFVAVSLVVWGRGTFCGWLCPFGALQEFTGKLGRLLHLPQLKIRARTDARLKLIKYALLAGIVASSMFSSAITDVLVEVEPFKTAITLNFVRSWPYVAYAAGLLLLSGFVYKFFCRYLCPFGAGLAVLGRLRVFNWLPRRKQCGTPCQTCRHRCDYQAIAGDGKIAYQECFQCMDCVVIYASDEKCAPLMLEKKKQGVKRDFIPIQAIPID
ncbi:transcriptional regulator of nitric oxide reductase [Herbaspirillum sp. SJZ130]|nr:transcriptional regulator of nitric oxide reductase [Herbaspirillum sp. SJZ130]TQK09988.1 transcriptional regulator of nitric oxide reductase [Herbaspirillum sp. SJZ106]